MEIICDTNIWYGIGNDLIDKPLIGEDDKFIATFNSLDELSFTENLINNYDSTQKAIRAMFEFSSKHALFEPPFVYLKVMSDNSYHYDIGANHKGIIDITQKIARGYTIDKIDFFEEIVRNRKESLKNAADFFNDYVQEHIKPNIKNKKAHRKENSIPLNRELINQFVSIQTGSDGLNENYNWGEIELFEKVLKQFFNDIETGAKKIKLNDWFDLFLLAYVSPRRKVWTREKYWIRLIKEVGMEKYLFES